MNLYYGGCGVHEFYTVAKSETEAIDNINKIEGMNVLPIEVKLIDEVDGYKIIPMEVKEVARETKEESRGTTRNSTRKGINPRDKKKTR